ncbi:unnamed protein product [Mytilus coruscus]|uniref:Uncharacterized protein n=1 Tax=Mytilus coruscus TaxID=42192 RepID=A0A6J8E4B8_MYTCO|nr:unnamed protein product [Mytilus coruscus]
MVQLTNDVTGDSRWYSLQMMLQMAWKQSCSIQYLCIRLGNSLVVYNISVSVSGTISIIVPGSFEKKLPPHSSLEALEVLSGTLPTDLRREEMAIRELGKINSYSNNVPIKRKFEIWKEEEHPEKFISPLGNYISDYNFTSDDNLQERLLCHHDKD